MAASERYTESLKPFNGTDFVNCYTSCLSLLLNLVIKWTLSLGKYKKCLFLNEQQISSQMLKTYYNKNKIGNVKISFFHELQSYCKSRLRNFHEELQEFYVQSADFSTNRHITLHAFVFLLLPPFILSFNDVKTINKLSKTMPRPLSLIGTEGTVLLRPSEIRK